jgi:hypothetical protein
MNVPFMDLKNGPKAPNLEGSLITPHMDGLHLGPIDDGAQAKQLKREKMRNYKRASQAQLATTNELGLSKKWFLRSFVCVFEIVHCCKSFSSILQVVLNRPY